MEGAIFERKNNVCVGSFELSKIQESQSFFKDIYKMQDEEIKILREKVEKNVRDLSGCYNKNWKLQTENDTLLLNKE